MDSFEKSYRMLVDEKIDFHQAIGDLLEVINLSIDQKDYQQATIASEEVKQVGDEIGNDLEKAQIRLECAMAEYKMQKCSQAIRELNTAIHLLEPIKDQTPNHAHYLAIILWMYGCLLLQNTPAQSMTDRIIAISALQNSLDIFDIYFGVNHQFVNHDPDWYQDRSRQMRQVIKAPAKRTSPAGKKVPDNLPKTRSSADHPDNHKTNRKRARIIPGDRKYLYVAGEIHAGPFSSSVLLGKIIDKINLNSSMEEFFLNGSSKPFAFFSLRDSGQIINLRSEVKYFLLKVIGDSMDKAGIDPDDYVLVQQLNNAQNRDIVVAEIIGIDTLATLKQYYRDERVVKLCPVSKNPDHKCFEFSIDSPDKFLIRGIVVGVFKPVL